MRFFRLGGVWSGVFISWLLVCLTVSESIENFLVGDCKVSSTAFMGIGFPNEPTSVDCVVLFNFRVGFDCNCLDWCCFDPGVAFWLTLMGDGAKFLDVDDPELVAEPKVAARSFSCLWSDWNSIPRISVFGIGRPPVLFPVAFCFDGLICCSFCVSFTGRPEASYLNIGCRCALGFSISKKRKPGPVLRADLYATWSLSVEGQHGPLIRGLGTDAKPLFLCNRGCFPFVWTHAVCGVYVRIFPSIVLYFCSKVFGSFTFVAKLIVFPATCSNFFFIVCSGCCCIPLYLKFNLSAFLFFTPVVVCGWLSTIPVFSATIGSGILRLMHSSSSDPICRSCIISARIGGRVKFFQSKQACLAFS